MKREEPLCGVVGLGQEHQDAADGGFGEYEGEEKEYDVYSPPGIREEHRDSRKEEEREGGCVEQDRMAQCIILAGTRAKAWLFTASMMAQGAVVKRSRTNGGILQGSCAQRRRCRERSRCFTVR